MSPHRYAIGETVEVVHGRFDGHAVDVADALKVGTVGLEGTGGGCDVDAAHG